MKVNYAELESYVKDIEQAKRHQVRLYSMMLHVKVSFTPSHVLLWNSHDFVPRRGGLGLRRC